MRVLLAADSSHCSQEALKFVSRLNWDENDQFMMISVVEALPDAPALFPASAKKHLEAEFVNRGELLEKYKEQLECELGDQFTVETNICCGYPAEEICKYSRAWCADLIVIGSHGRKGLEHLLLGSVAEKVLKNATCVVNVVKPAVPPKKVKSEQSSAV